MIYILSFGPVLALFLVVFTGGYGLFLLIRTIIDVLRHGPKPKKK